VQAQTTASLLVVCTDFVRGALKMQFAKDLPADVVVSTICFLFSHAEFYYETLKVRYAATRLSKKKGSQGSPARSPASTKGKEKDSEEEDIPVVAEPSVQDVILWGRFLRNRATRKGSLDKASEAYLTICLAFVCALNQLDQIRERRVFDKDECDRRLRLGPVGAFFEELRRESPTGKGGQAGAAQEQTAQDQQPPQASGSDPAVERTPGEGAQ
jgi:hypothetical protein